MISMQYGLRTLMLVIAVVPPLAAFVWFNWHGLLVAAIGIAILAAWFWVS